MKIFNIFILLSSFFSILFQLLSYRELSGKKEKITFKKFLAIFLIFWAIILNNAYNIELFTAPVGFILLVVVNLIVYEDKFYIVLNTTLISYLIAIIVEILVSVLLIVFDVFNINDFGEYNYLTFLFTFIAMFVPYIICKYFKFLKNILDKINDYSFKNVYKLIIIAIFLIILLIIDFKSVSNFSFTTYLINIVFSILILVIFIAYLNVEFKIKGELEKVDILLDNISKYEKYVDDNRINSHEMLNNLVLLKSIKNKNTKKFDKLLDEMIVTYDKSGKFIKNLSLLPKGIKGIIYFKLGDLSKKDYNITINISKQISHLVEKIDNEEYIILCKIIPILLDNAIDSLNYSKDKVLLFDVYKESDSIIISIENSCDEYVNVDKIRYKYFTTKGKNRGLGLYVVDELLSRTNKITLQQQYIGNIFISKIVINK